MEQNIFSISLQEYNGFKVWELDDIPKPNEVRSGTARYHGQRYVEQLMKSVNRKVFMNKEDRFLAPLYSILENSLENGVEDEAWIKWDDRSHYTRISWTGYLWKLPPEIKRRSVLIEILKIGTEIPPAELKVTLKKIADDKGDILIPPKVVSKLNLKNGDPVNVRMRICK